MLDSESTGHKVDLALLRRIHNKKTGALLTVSVCTGARLGGEGGDGRDGEEQLVDEPAPELVVIGRRDVRSNNSWMHNLPLLAKGRARCTLLVHPVDAARFGVRDGGRARVTADVSGASIDVDVEVDDAMMPGVVSLPHGWGHDQPGAQLTVAVQRPGSNLNVLTDAHDRDPLSGNPALSQTAVTIAPLP